MAETPAELVRRFCDAWSGTPDPTHLASFFSDDAVYHNVPIDPVVGPEAIRAFVTTFMAGVEHVEFRVRHLVADGQVVLTERLDVFTYAHTTVELPVMGAFEVRGGRIAAWRDYFDLNQYMHQLHAQEA